ncbi:hypothetical protein [Gorillibacterium sp. sgz5001074]|uniref:hypothetical protein n=1 Tax=Gorillibacterium sp. sgz5001074 TaxID=3446695 RepID=UPI003F66B92E
MFDPTVYENLKVVLEGAVYDLDLAGSIRITEREDLVNLATMSRTYRLVFELAERVTGQGNSHPAEEPAPAATIAAEVTLATELADLASEILELEDRTPGCSLDVTFRMRLADGGTVESACARIEETIRRVWGGRFAIRQTLISEYGSPEPPENRIRILFGRRFGEEVAEDFSRIVDHTVLSLEELARLHIHP